MSALQDMANELVAEREIAESDLAGENLLEHDGSEPEREDRRAHAGGPFARLREMSIARKLRALSVANMAAIFLTMAATGVAGMIALDMRDARMAVSETQVAAAQLTKQIEKARLHSQRYAVTSDTGEWATARASLNATDGLVEDIRTTAETYAPEAVIEIDYLADQLEGYDRELQALQSSYARYGIGDRTQTMADAIYLSGASFAEQAEAISTELRERGLAMDARSASAIVWIFVMLGLVTLVVLALILFSSRYLTRDVSGTLVELTAVAEKLAGGDKNVSIPARGRKDEIGALASALNVFLRAAWRYEKLANEKAERAQRELEERAGLEREREDLRRQKEQALLELAQSFETTVGNVVGSVASAASQLQATAGSMASAADQSSSQSTRVAKSMEQASAGVTAAAAASDEFAMSIGEISRQAASSASLARKATEAAGDADETISALSASADQVGKIVELI
ncbi:MAG: HAMP domain-containing protein, partial [Alphaproteobacteria bacterium]|nr:HAMP domain-containing protein [Alphaproteobacteria bacterium]